MCVWRTLMLSSRLAAHCSPIPRFISCPLSARRNPSSHLTAPRAVAGSTLRQTLGLLQAGYTTAFAIYRDRKMDGAPLNATHSMSLVMQAALSDAAAKREGQSLRTGAIQVHVFQARRKEHWSLCSTPPPPSGDPSCLSMRRQESKLTGGRTSLLSCSHIPLEDMLTLTTACHPAR